MDFSANTLNANTIPLVDEDALKAAQARIAEHNRLKAEREAQEQAALAADLALVLAAERQRIAKVKEEVKTLAVSYEEKNKQYRELKEELDKIGARIKELNQSIPPDKTTQEGVVVSTQKAALSPVKVAMTRIRPSDCKTVVRYVNGNPFAFRVLKSDETKMVNLEDQTVSERPSHLI